MFHQLDLEIKLGLYKITELSQLLCVVHRLVCRKSAKYIFRKFQLKISKRLSPTSNQQVPGMIGIGGKGIKGSTVKLQSSVISMHLFNAQLQP